MQELILQLQQHHYVIYSLGFFHSTKRPVASFYPRLIKYTFDICGELHIPKLQSDVLYIRYIC
jgi:hypothetical protein